MHIIESELVNLEHQFLNATNIVNELMMNHLETILPYLAIVSVIIGFLSCFLPCILCNTIKKILLLPCRCIRCLYSQRNCIGYSCSKRK